jgi:hypothetical protein
LSRAVVCVAACAVLGATMLGACSLLVGSEPEPLRCGEDGQVGPPACDEGQVCVAGICRSTSSELGEGQSAGEGGATSSSGGAAVVSDGGRRRG